MASKQKDLLEKAKKRALSSSIVQKMQEEYLDAPVEIAHSSGLKNAISKEERERTEYVSQILGIMKFFLILSRTHFCDDFNELIINVYRAKNSLEYGNLLVSEPLFALEKRGVEGSGWPMTPEGTPKSRDPGCAQWSVTQQNNDCGWSCCP